MKKLFDYLYSKSEQKEVQDKRLKEVIAITNKYIENAHDSERVIMALKVENHNLQIFIEEHVSEEDKKKIFK